MPVIGTIDIPAALAVLEKRPSRAGTAPKLRHAAVTMIRAGALAQPAFSFRIVPVHTSSAADFAFGESRLRVPALADVAANVSAVASVVCTLGRSLEARVSALCVERKLSLALALDEVGNELLLNSVRQALLQIRREARRQCLSSGNSFSPGCSGFSLDQQTGVVVLAGGDRLGISVTSHGMLTPVKSRSLIVPIGAGLSAQPLHRRCDDCSSRKQCRYQGL
ncbi:MAG TPA: hypothetical protein HPP97_02995 [Desulfuromonadales bacterium]|nr:hypothetical protein [Desulfuromonadales bacterium]